MYSLSTILDSMRDSVGIFRFEKNLQPNAPRKILN